MEKKIFNITGFNCANCAAKSESYVAKQEDIEYAHLDFSSNKFFITFKDKPWDAEKLKTVLKDVEKNELEISEVDNKRIIKPKIFTKQMGFLLARIIISLAIMLSIIFLMGYENLKWVRFGIYVATTILIGYDIFGQVFAHIRKRTNIIDHHLLISIAAIGALTLSLISLIEGESSLMKITDSYYIAMDSAMESVMVIALFQIGSIIESIAINKSKAMVMQAVDLRVELAHVKTKDGMKTMSPEELKIGDTIFVSNGELIPIDGEVIEGEGLIDTSSITGEFVPVVGSKGTKVASGCLLKGGSITVRVEKEYKDSTVSKIINLITNGSEKKSKADVFIAKFAKIYTPIIIAISIVALVLGGLITRNWSDWVHIGLEILVTGCPCAIVVSVPLAYFSAIGLGSKNGIIIKGTNYLDELLRVGKVISDKTGTLTKGCFKIVKKEIIGVSEDEFMEHLYAIESLSKHPIAKAISITDEKHLNYDVKDFEEIAGLGCNGIYKGKLVAAGNVGLMEIIGVDFKEVEENGTIVYLSIDSDYVGYIVLSDEVKETSGEFVKKLTSLGVETVLLTGDKENNAKSFANALGITKYKAELLPEEKTELLEKEMENYGKAVAFIGDGINDAPSIIRSDVGIAMGGIGSDIAVENADIVIMNDSPLKVVEARKIARMARNTSTFNIAFSLAVKAAVMILSISMPHNHYMMYAAVLANTGLTVLMVLNALMLLYRKVKV